MTDDQKQELYTDIYELLDIFNEFSPIKDDGTFILEAIKPTVHEMIDYTVSDSNEAAALKDWLDKTDFWTAPASTKFHGKYTITAEDIFIAAFCHDFCKTNFYGVEYRNTKDITGNWIKQPFYKTKSETRNLGHGNESVLILLEIMPSFIKKRYVLEAISRHMGFSDLSESESYNYSNFLDNPLVILLQLADQTASQWFNA